MRCARTNPMLILAPTLPLLRVALMAFAGSTALAAPSAAAPPPGYTLVWADEFHGPGLDQTHWRARPDEPANDGRNTPNAVSIVNDQLVITTYTQNGTHYTGMIQSGAGPLDALGSLNLYMPLYGYIEASIDFDGSKGMWSSFFVNTPNNFTAGSMDPRDRGTEVDIIEHKIFSGSCGDESARAPSAVHWITNGWEGYPTPIPSPPPDPDPYKRGAGGDRHAGAGSLATGLHVYGLEWTPDYQKIYYDNTTPVWTVNNCPTSQDDVWGCSGVCYPSVCEGSISSRPVSRTPEYIILGSEVSDNYNAYGNVPAGGFKSLGTSKTKLKVDYVRHYMPAPSGLVVTQVTGCQILDLDLAWNDNSYGLYGFSVERSTDGVNFTQIGTVGAGIHAFHDSGLSGTTPYCYRVRITNSLDNVGSQVWINAPAPVADLSVSNIDRLALRLSWTAPGSDDSSGFGTQYELRRSTSLITDQNWNNATVVATNAPSGSGFAECQVVPGLSACVTYYFAVKTRNEGTNWSAISNVVSAKTRCQGNNPATCPPPVPEQPSGALSVQVTGQTTAAVAWTVPQSLGTPMDYDLRYSTSNITASNFASAQHARMPTLPNVVLSQACHVIRCLSANTNYYFAVKIKDQNGAWTAMSNVQNASTTGVGVATCEPPSASRLGPATDEDSPSLSLSPSPNPARNRTSFAVAVPRGGAKLRVQVFDVSGRRVRSLVDRNASAGPARVDWNLLDDSGRRVAAAFYMIRIEMGNTRKTFPVVVLD